MEIVLDVSQSGEGRLTGTIRGVDGQMPIAFSGAMELLAGIEAVCRSKAIDGKSSPPPPGPVSVPQHLMNGK